MTNSNPSGLTRALVLAGPALALLATVFCLLTGNGVRFLRDVWFAAALWSFVTALAHVLWLGFRHGDWSAFNRHELPEGDGERFDWATKTGRYAWRREPGRAGASRSRPGRPLPVGRPPSRRTQTCKQLPCRLPRRALHPKEVGAWPGGGRRKGVREDVRFFQTPTRRRRT